MSIIRIFLFASLSVLCSLAQPIASFASDNVDTPKPYKATTIDECIQEKECFWHHLLLAVQTQSEKRLPTKYITVRKWDYPVRFRRIGPSDILNDSVSTKIVKQALPFFRQKFMPNEQYNFLVFVTDDIKEAISVKMKENFDALFGPNVALSAYKDAGSPTCFHLYVLNNQRSIQAYFAFIDRNDRDLLACYKETISSGFGISDFSYSPIVSSEHESDQFSKLELIILLYVYQDFIKSGMSYEQLLVVFDKSYDLFIEHLKKAGVINE